MEPKQAVPELLDNVGKKGSGGVQVGSLGTRPLSHPPRPAEAPETPGSQSPSFSPLEQGSSSLNLTKVLLDKKKKKKGKKEPVSLGGSS